MRHLPYPVFIVTFVLLINMLLALIDGPDVLVGIMFIAGPFLMVWMVLHVLKDKTKDLRDLANGEEWGYQDRPDLRPLNE